MIESSTRSRCRSTTRDPRANGSRVFARELADPDGRDRPFLVFFQGGPGFEARAPDRAARRARMGGPGAPRVPRADARPARHRALDARRRAARTHARSSRPTYLAHFRADSIVRDAEWIRRELGVERWSVLGQSFGGLLRHDAICRWRPTDCARRTSPAACPRSGRRIDEVYARTYRRVLDRSRRYYERYPDDRERVLRLLRVDRAKTCALPSGDQLTLRGGCASSAGSSGMSDGAENLHYLLELPPDSPAFLHDVERRRRLRATRSTRSCTRRAGPTAAPPAGRPRACSPAAYEREPDAVHRRAHLPVDVRGLRRARAAARRRRSCSPSASGRACTTRGARAATRSRRRPRSTPRTCTSSGVLRGDRPALIRGLRPWITNEYQHNGLRADGERDPRPADRPGERAGALAREAVRVGVVNGLSAVAGADLREHVVDVGLHRRLADDQRGGDLPLDSPRAISDRTSASRGVSSSGRSGRRRRRSVRRLLARSDQPAVDDRVEQRLVVGRGVDGAGDLGDARRPWSGSRAHRLGARRGSTPRRRGW